MSKKTMGIHHITAIVGHPQENVDFYAGVLGLRLVKQTVNFDDPGTYHLYFGDEGGKTGTIITFFPWADAIIFSVPTRFGNMPSQLKQFLGTTGGLWFNGKLVNKVVSAMTSAQNSHGGQEATILSLYTTMYHWGAIVAAPGYTDPVTFGAGGNPYGTSVTVGQDGKMIEDVQAAVKHQAKRTVTVAEWVKKANQ